MLYVEKLGLPKAEWVLIVVAAGPRKHIQQRGGLPGGSAQMRVQKPVARGTMRKVHARGNQRPKDEQRDHDSR